MVYPTLKRGAELHLTLDNRVSELEKKQVLLDSRITVIEKDFAQLRLDLKAAMILHDEPYVQPPVDELSAQSGPPKPKKESKKVTELKKNDPFDN